MEKEYVQKTSISSGNYVDCSQLNPGVRGKHPTSQLLWVAAWLFLKRVCPVHLMDRSGYIPRL